MRGLRTGVYECARRSDLRDIFLKDLDNRSSREETKF